MPVGSRYQKNVSVDEYGSSSDVDTEDGDIEPSNTTRGRQKQRHFGPVYPRPHSHLSRTSTGRRLRGGKHARRFENSMFLTTLYQIPEEELSDDPQYFLPEYKSSFSELFTNETSLEAWQTFSELSEDEQLKLLSHNTPSKNKKMEDPHKTALKKMDPRLSRILRHTKRLPMVGDETEYLRDVEEEIREQFVDDHSVVLVLLHLDSYHRMLLHAICQYNGLNSKSHQTDSATYMMIDTDKEFSPPSLHLHCALGR